MMTSIRCISNINLGSEGLNIWVTVLVSRHSHEVPLDLILQDEAYFHTDGILDPEWQSGDSIWSLVEDETLKNVLKKVTEL